MDFGGLSHSQMCTCEAKVVRAYLPRGFSCMEEHGILCALIAFYKYRCGKDKSHSSLEPRKLLLAGKMSSEVFSSFFRTAPREGLWSEFNGLFLNSHPRWQPFPAVFFLPCVILPCSFLYFHGICLCFFLSLEIIYSQLSS